MRPIAKLSELVDALEFSSDEYCTFFDRQSGNIVSVERFLLTVVEEGDQETLSRLPDWQRGEVEVARSIVNAESDRFIDPPNKFDFHEYRHMERFIQSLPNADAADQLWRAIKGRGAFRRFKDTADRLGLLEQWDRYRDEAAAEFVRDWAKSNSVPVEDDIRPRGSRSQ